MRNAIDFSYARPNVAEVAAKGLDVLVYTGNAIPAAQYLRDMRMAGVCITMIQESAPNRAQEGYGAGVADSNYANGKADSVNYPRTASIAFVVSDGSAGDPNYGGDNIAQYAAGVQSNSPRPFFFYGNRYAVDNAMRGAPKGLGCWVPSSWGAKATDLLVQEANTPSPFANTDLNTVHRPYGAWGQTNDTPAPPNQEDDEMAKPLYISKKSDADVGIWATDGVWKRHVNPEEWAFVKYVAPDTHPLPLSDSWWDSLINAVS